MLNGCGTVVNLMQHGKTEVRVRNSTSVFIPELHKVKSVHIICKNPTPYSEFNNITRIIQEKLAGKYKIVNNDSADLTIHCNVRHFAQIPNSTIENIDKYWQYTDSTDISTIKEINQNSFGIMDGSVGVTDIENAKIANMSNKGNENTSIIAKIAQNDFASGMSLGGLAGFWLFNSTPVGAIIGGMVGGTASFTSQHQTLPVTYMATLDVQITRKTNNIVTYNEKYVHKQDDNGVRWANFSTSDNKLHYRTRIYTTIKKSMLKSPEAAKTAVEKLSESIANSI